MESQSAEGKTAANAADRPTIICLTPVRNEAWILDRFLTCASLWADRIIVLDQCSDDGSRDIARKYPKVQLAENPDGQYDEGARINKLLELARQIPASRRLLLALDADEFLTANVQETDEWQTILNAAPGTVIRLLRVSLLPGGDTGFEEDFAPYGFMDDGVSVPETGKIHSRRVPGNAQSPEILCSALKLLHYQYMDWARMESKQRWYQCWEKLNTTWKRPIPIFRQYHFMYAIPPEKKVPVPNDWIAGYEAQGLEMRRFAPQERYRWDGDVVDFLAAHGSGAFRKINIWDVNWADVAQKWNKAVPSEQLRDPRTAFERYVHAWLLATQSRALNPKIRWVQRGLRLMGW